MPIKAVVFDLDGTLVDTAPDFIHVVNTLLTEEGRPTLSPHAIREQVSHGARALVTLAFGLQEGDNGFEALKSRLLDLYEQHLCVASQLFPGMDELLQQLDRAGLQWGIATNKPARYASPLIDNLQLKPGCLICPEHVSQSKPHPDSLILAAELLQCGPSEIVYVGDHQRDIECGRRAGSMTLAAAYGYLDGEEDIRQWRADHTIESASDIWPLIKSLR